MHLAIWKHRSLILGRLAAKAFYKLLGKLNTRLQPYSFFYIKPGYHHTSTAETFDATRGTDEYQRSVYELAASIAQKLNNPSIIDVGCGSAYKLVNMLGQYTTTGIEVGNTHQWLLKKYPTRKWLLFDETLPSTLQADIVICSDVIEHIKNPNELMEFLNKIRFSYLVISTPDRDSIAGKNDYGPPENTSHYREWNVKEFANYVGNWFAIEQHHVLNDKSITQAVVCTKLIAGN